MTTSLSDSAQQTERALLGSVLLDNSLWPKTESLSADDFSLDAHRSIYRQMAKMFEDGVPVDSITLTDELSRLGQLEKVGDVAYVADLIVGGFIPQNFPAYVRCVLESACERNFQKLQESLIDTSDRAQRLRILGDMQELMKGTVAENGFESLFHKYVDLVNAPDAEMLIDGFLPEGITLIGGLAGHGKTWLLLFLAKALLEGSKLFDKFQVRQKVERIIYLSPEARKAAFVSRLNKLNLLEYVEAGRLFVRTLEFPGKKLALTDSVFQSGLKDSVVILDTAARFMDGQEDVEGSAQFGEQLFDLQRAGARAVVGAHHSPKILSKEKELTLENVLRGSGDIGSWCDCCWGVMQVNKACNRVFLQCVKPRDFEPVEPFVLEGRPSIDERGFFDMTHPPGLAGSLDDHRSLGRPEMADKQNKRTEALRMKEQGVNSRDIAAKLHVGKSTVNRWLNEGEVTM